jgi:hypothetical protein
MGFVFSSEATLLVEEIWCAACLVGISSARRHSMCCVVVMVLCVDLRWKIALQ